MFAGCRIVHRPHKHEVSPFSNQGHALARGGNASLYPLFVAGLRSRLVIIPPSRQRWPGKSCRLLWAPPPTTHRHTSGTSTAGCGESGALGTHEAKVAESLSFGYGQWNEIKIDIFQQSRFTKETSLVIGRLGWRKCGVVSGEIAQHVFACEVKCDLGVNRGSKVPFPSWFSGAGQPAESIRDQSKMCRAGWQWEREVLALCLSHHAFLSRDL